MNIRIEKKNFEQLNIENLRSQCGQALDLIWNTGWMRFAITKTDRSILAELQTVADKLSQQSDILMVLADGEMSRLIEAAAAAANPKEEKTEIIVFGDTLSPADYADVLYRLENKSFSILAAAGKEESLQLRGAYVTLKQLLIQRFGKEQAAQRLYAMAGPKSKFFAKEAAEEDFPLISLPDFPAEVSANTAAVLLPLAVKGVNVSEYLDGFYDMMASPAWDLDGADYALGLAASGLTQKITYWQSQLKAFAQFQGESAMLPAFAEAEEEGFETMLLIEKDAQDIMMPFFEGCHEDGSLNLLMVNSAAEAFSGENPGVKITLPVMDDYNLGQLFAFFQLSGAIAEYMQNVLK